MTHPSVSSELKYRKTMKITYRYDSYILIMKLDKEKTFFDIGSYKNRSGPPVVFRIYWIP